ncbi:hypothetical protein LCGC14_1447150 [marine sediment metagenome]|uniref:Uncharacterized protein n=1 Tax=marine sediment metagenome TaxID=412755 RepID=A0A0F9JIX0_9ZZZZ
MNRHFSSERFLAGCLLVALISGIITVKIWVVSVEHRLDGLVEILAIGMDTEKSQTNVLYNHERRLRRVERTAWAVWDHHAPCDGWPSQQQIAQGE